MKPVYILFLLTLLFTACKKENSRVTDPCACAGEEICTENFVTLTIKLTGSNGQPYQLDSFSTTALASGEVIHFRSKDAELDAIWKTQGSYPILGDNQLATTEKCGSEYEFSGIKNGVEVIKRAFTIGHDCCHVKVLKGETEVVISE